MIGYLRELIFYLAFDAQRHGGEENEGDYLSAALITTTVDICAALVILIGFGAAFDVMDGVVKYADGTLNGQNIMILSVILAIFEVTYFGKRWERIVSHYDKISTHKLRRHKLVGFVYFIFIILLAGIFSLLVK